MFNMRRFFLLTIIFAMIVTAVAAENKQVNSATDFFDISSFDPAIPEPEQVIDLPAGLSAVSHDPLDPYSQQIREKVTSHSQLLSYMQKLAALSDRITLTPCGKSYEGRTLFYMTITSPANHKKLDEIKALNAKLNDPRKLTKKDSAKKIIKDLPGIAWLDFSIHGDEFSSTDAAIYIAYRLTASKEKEIL